MNYSRTKSGPFLFSFPVFSKVSDVEYVYHKCLLTSIKFPIAFFYKHGNDLVFNTMFYKFGIFICDMSFFFFFF